MKKTALKPGPSINPMKEDRAVSSSPMYTCPSKMTVSAKHGSRKG